jgi:hypothetical protein
MKKLKLILAFTICTTILFSCKDSKKTESETEINESNPSENSELDQLKTESSRLRNGGSIKTVELENGKALITYVKNYAEYKELNPQSSLTENELTEYWNTNDAIEKALVDGSVKIMKKLNFIKQVEIILPYKNKTYTIDVEKTELEKFIGKDFNEIISNWDEEFSNPYVYDETGRKNFFKKFGVIN